jgi:exonuclease III
MVTSNRVDVICLQETKMAAVSRGTLVSVLGSDFTFLSYLP